MGNTPDVRVRLSAEGELSIINAFKKIQAEADKTGRIGSRGLNALSSSAANLGRFLPSLTFAAAIAGATVMAKRALETADNFVKLSQKTGVSVETLSGYAHGANLAGIDTEVLALSLGRLTRTMNAAAQGDEQAKRPFHDLGIEFKTQQGILRPLDDLFGDLADKFAAMPDGPRKSALAIELLGRSGQRLIPFLNQGRAGLAEMKAEAERLGLVFDTKTALSAEQLNDNLKRLQGTVQGFINRELAALLPLLIELSNDLLGVADDADTAGISLGQRFALGILTGGAALRALGGMLKDFGTKGGFAGIMSGAVSFRENFEKEMKTVEEIVFRSFSGPPALPNRPRRAGTEPPIVDEAARTRALDAARKFADAQLAMEKTLLDNELALAKAHNAAQMAIDQDRFKAGLTAVQDFFAQRRAALESEAAKEIEIAEKQVRAIEDRMLEAETRPRKKGETTADREAELLKVGAELEKAVTEVEVRRITLTGERAKIDSEERDEVRKFNTEELTAQAQILTAQNQRFEASRVELEAQISQVKRLAGETEESFVERQRILREAGESQIRFEEIQAEARRTFSDLESSRIQIETLVTRGVITEREGQVAVAELEKDRLPVLREIAAAMKAAAITPEQIEAARQFNDQLEQLAASSDLAGQRMAEFKKAVGDALTSDLANFFSRGIDDATSFGDAMRKLAESVVQSLREIASQMLANLAIQALMGAIGGAIGGAAGFSVGGVGAGAPVAGAGGGLVRGPGTSTSDSIPARLSDEEFVVRAAVVRQPGVLSILNTLNERGIDEFRKSIESFHTMQIRPMPRAHNYARGGLVVDGEPGQRGSRLGGLRAEVGLDRGLLLKDLAADSEFDRVIVRTMERNRRAVRALLR
jgi:hypothetical protein